MDLPEPRRRLLEAVAATSWPSTGEVATAASTDLLAAATGLQSMAIDGVVVKSEGEGVTRWGINDRGTALLEAITEKPKRKPRKK